MMLLFLFVCPSYISLAVGFISSHKFVDHSLLIGLSPLSLSMTPYYVTQFSPIPLVEGDHDHQSHLYPFTLPTDHTSSVPSPLLFQNPQVQAANDTDHYQQQLEFIDHLLIQGPSNCPVFFPTKSLQETKQSFCNGDQYSIKEEDDQQKSGKWMSSKMRIMRKMMNTDGATIRKPRRYKKLHQEQQSSTTQPSISSSSDIVRVCSDCNTTNTPLWRSGPSGPKSLCNACGIRQRKARRALAAAAAAAVSGGLIPAAATTQSNNKVRKEKESDLDQTVPFKKRYRFSGAEAVQKKLCLDDIVISLSKSSAFHRVFPQDEKDAAILLMSLSCGLICS